MYTISTSNLELASSNLELINFELNDFKSFVEALGVEDMPAYRWPPPLNDRTSQEYMLKHTKENLDNRGWTMWYFMRKSGDKKYLIGNGGYKGVPVAGTVEIGYSILEELHGKGYGTEIVSLLTAWAFEHEDGIAAVRAQTLPSLPASMRVLTKNGYELIENGEVLTFEITRAVYLKKSSSPVPGVPNS